MLVELGYVAFAADMFGGRMRVPELPKAIEIITADLLGNPPKLLARADAALEVLRQRPEVDAARLGGIGFLLRRFDRAAARAQRRGPQGRGQLPARSRPRRRPRREASRRRSSPAPGRTIR